MDQGKLWFQVTSGRQYWRINFVPFILPFHQLLKAGLAGAALFLQGKVALDLL